MKTMEIGESNWKVRLDPAFADWLNDKKNARNEHVRNELAIAFDTWRREGEFSINTERFDFTCGGQAKKKLREALNNCPFIKRITTGQKNGRSARWRFVGLAQCQIPSDWAEREGKKQPTDSGFFPVLPFSSRILLPPSVSSSLVLVGFWLRSRAERWADWCEKKRYPLKVDYLGRTPQGRAVFEALAAIEFPHDRSFLYDISNEREHEDRQSPREFAEGYYRRSLAGQVVRQLMSKSGRQYHWITRCPRPLRRLLMIDGQRLGEADVAASYFTFLAGQLAPCAEKSRLVGLLKSGSWYSWLAEVSQMEFTDDSEVKTEAQRQLLFGRDWRIDSRPMWTRFASEFPKYAALINRKRRQLGGPSGFAHYLTGLEGAVMGPAMLSLIDQCVLTLSLHDGLLIGESHIDLAAQTIRDIARDLLGFEPLVRAK